MNFPLSLNQQFHTNNSDESSRLRQKQPPRLRRPGPGIGFTVRRFAQARGWAAGAIPPKNAFNNGADFVLAGMFDFEITEDTQFAREAIASYTERPRPWTV